MLEEQPWLNYAELLSIEWRQAADEGRKVDEYREICKLISEKAKTQDCTALAREIREKLLHAPVKESFDFEEPSDLKEILAARPAVKHDFENRLSEEMLMDKLKGAWTGRICGCLLGKPVEGRSRKLIRKILDTTDNFPMHKYMAWKEFPENVKEELGEPSNFWIDRINGISPSDDDTNYTVLAMKLIEVYGKDFRPNDVLEAWLLWMPMFATCTAERVAYRNTAIGLRAPETANWMNPFREWIGAQIRGDFFGYINPGNPEAAAEMAWKDASISHVKNGIYGEMFIAAMIAAAAVHDNMEDVIIAGLEQIPEKCRLRKYIDKVRQWYKQGMTMEQMTDQIHGIFDETNGHDWCHTISNAMIVTAALLWGECDFGKTICAAVQAAFDTDCNGATVGSIVGIMRGAKEIPAYWTKDNNESLKTNIEGYNEVTIDELARKTRDLMK